MGWRAPGRGSVMRVLLVDNHDSYTYNLFQLIADVVGSLPLVLTNDDPRWGDTDPVDFDAAVISPGPGGPHQPQDIGEVPRVLDVPHLPVLGVCLGHQAIAHLAGVPVVRAPAPRHGHLTRVRHRGTGLFAGLPQDFTAVRYHSLAVPDPLADPLTDRLGATAWAEDGVVMGLEHLTLPRWSVQFHPESVASEHGREIVANFAALADGAPRARAPHRTGPRARPPAQARHALPPVHWRTLEHAVDTQAAFAHLYSASRYAFWLDSSRAEGTARFSYLGDPTGPHGEVLTYRVGAGSVVVDRAGRATQREPGTIFDALQRRVAAQPHRRTDLPFDFAGGYVGYLGYELKADCGARAAHRAPTPDAVWLRCDRFVAVDHAEGRTYVVVVGDDAGAESWLADTEAALAGPPAPRTGASAATPQPAIDLEASLETPREGYLAAVKECLAQLASGESYEVCLTNRLRVPANGDDDLTLYRRMRAASPAPYAALLRLGDMAVLSASPERFLRIDAEGTLDSRPIKGTAPRHPDPTTDTRLAEDLRTGAKTRAENLMIVDLLRNDLGRVCEVGSVHVPAFMYTASYATVHQLVSTVRGRLRADVHPVEAVRACFPGGSMTGAPKLRTMDIIDRLEPSARGVYSGALGYLSDTGTADLSIVIRTAVRHGGELTIGAGGAIVLDSDPDEEYAEMLLKAAVPARAARVGH